jgi:hypothetical protein
MAVPAWLDRLVNTTLERSVRTQEYVHAALCWGIAAMAFVSLNPYFMWEHQKLYYALASLLLVASLPLSWPLLSFSSQRMALMLGFSLFLVYLSLLSKMDGGVTRWFLLIPFAISLLAVRREALERSFGIFYWAFALSLIPGILLWIWTVAGLPVKFHWMTPPSDSIQRGIIDYFTIPGAVVLPSNARLLPHGGVIFRLCGVYDEPGTLGTIAALCLAATRFRLRDPRSAIVFTAGLMSFSVAFAIIVTIGFLAVCVTEKKWTLLPAAVVTAFLGALVTGLISLNYKVSNTANIMVVDPRSVDVESHANASTNLAQFGLDNETRLRFSSVFDNRAQPKMRELFRTYLQSPPKTILLGIASDASIRTDGSSVWFMVLTNYGAIGFLWLFLLFSAPLVLLWREDGLGIPVVIFCLLYLMSFYQRPIVWLPAQLLIYFAGILCFRSPQKK